MFKCTIFFVRIVELLRFLYSTSIKNHHTEFKIDRTILTFINYLIKKPKNSYVKRSGIDYRIASLSTRYQTAKGIIP